jgi:hypothetical protein
MDTCYIVVEGATVDVRRDTKEAVTRLLFSYYVWNLSYPKQYLYIAGKEKYKLQVNHSTLIF